MTRKDFSSRASNCCKNTEFIGAFTLAKLNIFRLVFHDVAKCKSVAFPLVACVAPNPLYHCSH
jgi:hypothetical protein